MLNVYINVYIIFDIYIYVYVYVYMFMSRSLRMLFHASSLSPSLSL